MEWFRSLDMFLLSSSNNVYIDRTAEKPVRSACGKDRHMKSVWDEELKMNC